jgi:hypothetical protein
MSCMTVAFKKEDLCSRTKFGVYPDLDGKRQSCSLPQGNMVAACTLVHLETWN